jgi:hypothetical protein
MITLFGKKQSYCDGVARREFLRIGALGVGAGAFNMVDLLRAEQSQAKVTGKKSTGHKAVINVFLGGGPPHQDMWDLKPDAPADIRGEFKPISTQVPGIQIGETFPQIAARMKQCAIIRSLVGATGGHDAIQCMSGWPPNSIASMGGRPSMGAAVSKMLGPTDPSVPAFVGLAARTQHVPWSDPGTAGFLGPSYACFKPDGPGMENLKMKNALASNMSERKGLMERFDSLRREIDTVGQIRGMDTLTEKAMGVLTSSKLVEALDLNRENEKTRARYGSGRPYQFQYDGAPTVNDHLLLARRLVEAGVRVVTLSYGRWDSHGKNFDLVRDHGAKLDQGISALIDDLTLRGMIDDVAVVVWGEFGRTPRINKDAGRDHWPQVAGALLFGGGIKGGTVVGATNRLGEHAKERPVQFGEVFATLYKSMGLDPATNTLIDQTGRPQHLTPNQPMPELI